MKVQLISSNTERLTMAVMPIGLLSVEAAVRAAGHEVRLLDLLFDEDPEATVARAVTAFRPDVIGISVRNVDDQDRANTRFLLEAIRPVIAACRRASRAPIVLGGAGYSIFPDEALAYLQADFGVRGDGERAFVRLLERLQSGQDPAGLPGIHAAGRPGEACEPEWSPLADPSASHLTAIPAGYASAGDEVWAPIQSRRGCGNDCSYCSTRRIQGRRIRRRAPAAVIDEMESRLQGGFRQFYFVDNAFNIPESHAMRLCELLAGRRLPGLRWRCILYPHKVTERLVEALRRAGCFEVSLGFESGNDRILKALNKRFRARDVRQVNELLLRHGIRRTGFLLFGAPGETRETVEESLAFAASLDLDALRVTIGIRVYPDTPLARMAAERGMIRPDESLLYPKFYLEPGLEPWIYGRVKAGFFNYR